MEDFPLFLAALAYTSDTLSFLSSKPFSDLPLVDLVAHHPELGLLVLPLHHPFYPSLFHYLRFVYASFGDDPFALNLYTDVVRCQISMIQNQRTFPRPCEYNFMQLQDCIYFLFDPLNWNFFSHDPVEHLQLLLRNQTYGSSPCAFPIPLECHQAPYVHRRVSYHGVRGRVDDQGVTFSARRHPDVRRMFKACVLSSERTRHLGRSCIEWQLFAYDFRCSSYRKFAVRTWPGHNSVFLIPSGLQVGQHVDPTSEV